jgi:Uncharacterized protein conserved in bacteria
MFGASSKKDQAVDGFSVVGNRVDTGPEGEHGDVKSADLLSHPSDRYLRAFQEARQWIAPSWDIRDYVAVNPFFGVRGKRFLRAMKYAEAGAWASLLPPRSFFQERYEAGEIQEMDLTFALRELQLSEEGSGGVFLTVERALAALQQPDANAWGFWGWGCGPEHERSLESPAEFPVGQPERLLVLSDLVDEQSALEVSPFVTAEVSKWLAAYFDTGQALWQMPYREQRLFSAWRRVAEHDRAFDRYGYSLCKLVKSLPSDPLQAIVRLAAQIEAVVPLTDVQ